jgi:glycosyltransferase involved in cell wall biosynthesis
MKNNIENQVKVTIITPSYNQGQFIEDTILSVLNQTYKNIQYIIVDGASTDCTMDIVERYRDRIDLFIHENDKGQADAINKGFKLAAGEIVGWLNSDDVLQLDAVQKVVDLYRAKNGDAAVIMPAKVEWIDENNTHICTKSIYGRSAAGIINHDFNIIQPGSFYKLNNLKKIGFCNVNLNYCMDLDLILRLLKIGNIYFIEEALSKFRIHTTTKTTTGKNDFLKEIKLTLKKNGVNIFSKNSYMLHTLYFKNIVKNVLGIR